MIHVITGPPCAGKSTYIKEHAQTGDLVIDFDVIGQTLGAKESHETEGLIREATFAARKAAIETALKYCSAESWIIDSMPTPAQTKKYRDAGAEILLIDPGKAEVMRRAAKDKRPEVTYKGIDDWYLAKEEKARNPEQERLPIDKEWENFLKSIKEE